MSEGNGRSARPLLLVGTGGFARETLELVNALNRVEPTWHVVGMLDDDPATHGRDVLGFAVVGPSAAVHDHPDALVAACVASPDDPMRRLALVARLDLPAERYATLVHPTAVVPTSASIGPGSVVHAGITATCAPSAPAPMYAPRSMVTPPATLTRAPKVTPSPTTSSCVSTTAGITATCAPSATSAVMIVPACTTLPGPIDADVGTTAVGCTSVA